MARAWSFVVVMMAAALAACSRPAPDPHLPEPVQVNGDEGAIAPGMHGLATFSGRVLVLSRMDYPLKASDPLSAVSPTDLAVAWGPSARADVYGRMHIWQANRRFAWRVRSSEMTRPEVRSFTLHAGNWR